MLSETDGIPFGDLASLEAKLKTRHACRSSFWSLCNPKPEFACRRTGYLEKCAGACAAKFGTLLVLDEVQTGMYRTGSFLAAHRYGRGTRHCRAGQSTSLEG